MNKSVLAAAALAGATVLTGASVSSSAAPSTDARAAHVLRWKTHAITDHEVGRNGFVGADVIRSRRTNNIIGYTSISGKFLAAQNAIRAQAAFAVKGGIIVVRGQAPLSAGVLTGPVVSGTGKFRGISGTATVRGEPNNNDISYVTLRVNY